METSSTDPTIVAQSALSQFAVELIREQSREKRQRVRRRFFVLLCLTGGLFFAFAIQKGQSSEHTNPHVGVIDVKGPIFDQEAASADNFTLSLKDAYSSKGLKALVLRIDSPGGSPVQADEMYNTLQHYRKKHDDIKIYAVCVDTCASAAYYVAAAADEIYANPSSIVGSIGVLYNGFGFVDTLQKLGVTRRLQTAGRNKGFMDQFSPTTPQQEQTLQVMLDLIHQTFMSKVKAGRGDRLLIDSDTFSGLFWTGIQAKQRGLIDGFASVTELTRDHLKIESVVDYSYKENPFERVAKHVGIAMVNGLPEALGFKGGFQ